MLVISVVIPMYNEQNVIARTLDELCAALARNFGEYEVVVVDDGSADGCAGIVRAYKNDRVRLLSYGGNRGKGCAVRTGMLDARGDIVFFCDADLAYGTDIITSASKQLQSGADIVIASRKLDKDAYARYPFMRKVASRGLGIIVRMFLGLGVSDTQAGLKGFTKQAARDVFSQCTLDGIAFDFEALCIAEKQGLRIAEVPGRIINHNESKMRLVRDSVRVFRDILTVRRLYGKHKKRLSPGKGE